MDIGFYWDLGAHVEDIAEMVVTSYLLYYFAKPFLNKNKYVSVVGITHLIVIIILYISFDILHIQGATADAIAITAVFAVMCFIDCRNIRQKIFLAVIMYLIIRIAGSIEAFLIVLLREILLESPFVVTRPVLQVVLFLITVPVDVGLIFMVASGLLYIVGKTYTYKKEDIQSKELALVLATPLAVIVGNIILSFYADVYLADTGQYIWNPHPEYLWVRLVYRLVSFAAIMAVIIIYQNIRGNHRQEKENAVLSEQVEQTKRNIKEIERLHQDVYRLRHDMGNHVTILENLLLKNEPQETEKYLLRLKEQM